MSDSRLTQADYTQLAQIMTGPHGQPASADEPLDLLVVFSCADAQVGRSAAQLYAEGHIRHVVFSGGVGKDSGGLPLLGIAEAVFLASVAIAAGLPTDVITLELEARNGKENAELSLKLAAELGLLNAGARIASLAPAPRSRRLYEELRYQVKAGHYGVKVAAGFSSGAVEPVLREAQEELVRELRGLATMHVGDTPRILPQAEFQPGGLHYDLIERAGIAAD